MINMYTIIMNVLGPLCNFYKNLFSSKPQIKKKFQNIFPIQISQQNEKQICEYVPTLKECEEAIKSMKNNKSPGNDRILIEFYELFCNEIKSYF